MQFPSDPHLYAQQGAAWVDELVSWALNHSTITGEDQRLLSWDSMPEPWISPFMELIPLHLRSQLEFVGNAVAGVRAAVMHPHLLRDDRNHIGRSVDYLTPREVRNVLVRQFQHVGRDLALGRFHALHN
jgi:hypothetical protein